VIDPLWLKALHLIALIAWMAGIFYLPRLYVYHAETEAGSRQSENFKVMERRLLRAIMTPAMIATWLFGVWAAASGGYFADGWLHAKLVLVVAMTAFHMALASWRKAFAEDRNTRSARFFRIANEVPTLLLVGIVILAVVRPF